MAYSSSQLPSGLDTLDNTTIATGDLAIVGDTSDSGRVKAITLANLETKIASDLNLSGTNTGDQTITISGDADGSGTSGITLTLDTVNSNVGTFGNSGIPVITVNGKGLVTAVSTTPVAIALTASGVTGTLPIAHGGTGTISITLPASGDLVGRTDAQTLTGKTFDTASNTFKLAGTTITGATGTGGSIVTSLLPTFPTGINVGAAGINLDAASGGGRYIISVTDAASAPRFFNWVLNDASRTINMSGNLTVASTSSIGGTAYVVGGTDVPLADGGTGSSLAATATDAILFYDVSQAKTDFLYAGSGLSISGTTITSTASGGTGLTWVEATSNTTAVVNRGYIMNSTSAIKLTLPASSTSGDIIRIVGKGTGGWLVGLNASQQINFGNLSTTVGINGSLASTHRYDSAELLSISTTYDWNVISSQGNITLN